MNYPPRPQHIASQKSLCQLCINLFPNCKWSPSNEPLVALTSISQFIGSFYLNSQKLLASRSRLFDEPVGRRL